MARLIDNLNWKGYSERELLRITAFLEPMVKKIYEECFWVIHIRQICTEAATSGVLRKSVFLKFSQNSQENICSRVSFLIKLQAWGQQL